MKKYAFWLRMAGALLCILLELYFLAPAAMGIWHVGMLYPMVPLTLLSVWLSCPRLFDRLPRWLCRAGAAVVGAGAAVVLAVMVLMGIQAGHRPTEGDCTVIVLGCQVSRDGSPTVMLDDRIDAAYRYLAEHPESRCVASGGQNDNEPISEASCIRNTLVARGIHPDRIYLEDRSRSTEENLTFSAELIRKEGLPARVAIASDNFHQLRAAVWARRGGLDPWSIGCVTWWPLSPGYWRSAAGELKDLRRLVFMALMIAACIVLSHCSIRLGESLSLSVTFLARALCSLVCGPLAVIVFGAAEDTLSFFLSSGGYPYFPGYMLTTITGCMIYALFFYRAKITWRRIILAKLLTNIQNVLLGALWSAILYSKGYLYYLTQSAVKNALYLPLQILLLGFLLQAVLPVMQRQRWLPEQLPGGRLRW